MNRTIAYLSLYTEMGGGEYGLFHLIKNLDRQRFTPLVVVPSEGPLCELLRNIGVETVAIPFRVVMLKDIVAPSNVKANFEAARKIKQLFRERDVRVVQCGDVLALLLLVPAFLTRRLVIIYNLIFFYERVRMMLFNALALIMVRNIVCLSKMIADDLHRKTVFLKSKTTTIYWGVDSDRFRVRSADQKRELRRQLGLPEDRRIVGFIGRYDVWKGHLTFLEAARHITGLRGDVDFLITGGAMTENVFPSVRAYHDRVVHWIQEHPLGDRLIVWGHRDDIPEIMAALDVFVCPSDFEPYGLVVLEALSSGIPVVVTTSVGALEVLTPGDGMVRTGRPGDAESFTTAIMDSLEAPRSTVASRSVRCPDWKSAARSYESLLAAA